MIFPVTSTNIYILSNHGTSLRNFYHDYLNNKIIPCKGLELIGQELNAPEM